MINRMSSFNARALVSHLLNCVSEVSSNATVRSNELKTKGGSVAEKHTLKLGISLSLYQKLS